MRILIVCPARAGTRHGNRVTALRWARILRSLGHRVAVHEAFRGRPPDLLIALHARKSAASALGFRARRPEAPLIVALTGTDVYRDIYRSRAARRVLEAAARLVVLQPLALRELRRGLRPKVRVIHQSALPVRAGRRAARTFDICVAGHLRSVK